MFQNPNFPGFHPGPHRGAYSAPLEPIADGEGARCPSQEPHPRSQPFGPCFCGCQGLTHYRVGNRFHLGVFLYLIISPVCVILSVLFSVFFSADIWRNKDIYFKCRPIWNSYFSVSENRENVFGDEGADALRIFGLELPLSVVNMWHRVDFHYEIVRFATYCGIKSDLTMPCALVTIISSCLSVSVVCINALLLSVAFMNLYDIFILCAVFLVL